MKRTIAFALALVVAGISPLLADQAATVTEAVNDVSHGSSESAITAPAKSGTVIQDGEYLKTGTQSRAELTLANQSITRLGSNTILNYSVASNQLDLQAGTMLFSKPKDGKEMTIKTASVTAAIVGTTGFLSLKEKEKIFIFGLVEGHAKVKLTADGKNYDVGAGQLLRFTPDGKAELLYFNVPLFLKTSPLFTKFKGPLPNQIYIDAEVKKYDDFTARGFVSPVTEPYFVAGDTGFVPIMPIPARDSAGNAQNMFNISHMPPMMSPTNGNNNSDDSDN
jgi:hypothetical protein